MSQIIEKRRVDIIVPVPRGFKASNANARVTAPAPNWLASGYIADTDSDVFEVKGAAIDFSVAKNGTAYNARVNITRWVDAFFPGYATYAAESPEIMDDIKYEFVRRKGRPEVLERRKVEKESIDFKMIDELIPNFTKTQIAPQAAFQLQRSRSRSRNMTQKRKNSRNKSPSPLIEENLYPANRNYGVRQGPMPGYYPPTYTVTRKIRPQYSPNYPMFVKQALAVPGTPFPAPLVKRYETAKLGGVAGGGVY